MAHVLIVDDDEQVRSVLQRMLAALGHVADTVADGRLALEYCAARRRISSSPTC